MSVKGIGAWIAMAMLACMAPRAWAGSSCSPNCPSATASGAISSTIMGPVTVASAATLAFGTLVRPATSAGNGTVTVDTSGTRSVTGTGLALGSTSATRARFTITGEGAASITVSTPTSISLTSGSNSLTVTLTRSPSDPAQKVGGTAGSNGTLAIDVGGSFPLNNTTVPGAYTGSLTLTASYQ